MTQRQIILKLLREDPKWFYSYELIKVATKHGWLGTSADRVCRKLVEEGHIEKQDKGQYVQFRGKAPRETIPYFVNGKLVYEKKIY